MYYVGYVYCLRWIQTGVCRELFVLPSTSPPVEQPTINNQEQRQHGVFPGPPL